MLDIRNVRSYAAVAKTTLFHINYAFIFLLAIDAAALEELVIQSVKWQRIPRPWNYY